MNDHTLAGAYAMDALDPLDARRFERHLASCDACAQEVAELRETAARLGAATVVPPLTPLNVRLLKDGRLAAKACGKPVGGGRGAYVSFPVPDTPELASLVAEAATRAGALWTAHRGLS